jgi:Flp pilus assembly protein TadG
MKQAARRHHESRGQALPEFALIAPLFFLLLFGIIEAGRFIYYYEVLNNATREGARYAIVNGQLTIGDSTGPDTGTSGPPSDDPTGEDVVRAVRNAAIGVLGPSITVQRCWWYTTCDFSTHGDGNFLRGATVTVHATYTYSSLIPLVPLPNITVEAESSLVINN